MIDQGTIQRVMDAADIVDVVREFVTLRKAGVNYKGLCPFHNEKTPSFIVSPAKQLCKCFSCGKGGNAAHFLMEIEQLSYPEAIKWLGKKYGIEVKEKELTDEERAAASVRESMFVLNEWACGYFEDTLHTHPDGLAIGKAYFRSRNLRDDIIRRFQLGYATRQRDAMSTTALSKGYSRELLLRTGLSLENETHQLTDRYRGRVIFPVHSVSGKIVAFGGRILSNDKKLAKYVNSPESDIYSKSHELYGLYHAKKAIVRENHCYMVEGYMDVISMHQSGVENVVASSGTSLTENQIRLLHRFTDNVTVLYDGDAAGIHASLRGIDMLLAEGMNIKVLLLPDGEDPDSFASKHSAEDFRTYISEHQTDFITFKTDLLMQNVGNDPVKRAELIKDIAQSIAAIPEGITRQTFAHECAMRLNIHEQVVLDTISRIRRTERQKHQSAINGAANIDTASAEEQLRQDEQAELTQLANMMARGDTAQYPQRMLIQQIIRHGEALLTIPSEDNAEASLQKSVAEWIESDLASDGITFSNPLYEKILHEASELARQGKLHALPHFLSHPDMEISKLANELGTDNHQLSRSQQEQYGNEIDHLKEIIPRLLNDFKYCIIQEEKAQIERNIQQLYTEGRMQECQPLMERYKTLSELFAIVSKMTGEKVVIKRDSPIT